MPLSVAIIAQDEEDRISDCLKSVSFADEVLVVDSGSQDQTVSIAEFYGCRVISKKWMGYAQQKQFAVDSCCNDWVLILDADERLPRETAEQVEQIIETSQQGISAYSFLRKNFFHNRWVRHCGWWPDRVVRMVDRRQGHFSDNLVHERWISNGPVKELDLNIEHRSFRNYSDLVHKMETYSSLSAQEMLNRGKRVRWWSPFSHGLWMFIRTYILEMGMMAGFDGFMISLFNAGGSFMKYAKLRESLIHGDYRKR
jgi:glycosyltransferase involved in cell wall biosynthesis